MKLSPSYTVGRYLIALALAAAALGIRLIALPYVGTRAPFITFFIAIIFVAWRIGMGPAILVTISGGLASAFFLFAPYGSLEIADPVERIWLVTYGLASATMITAIEAQRRAKALADRNAELADSRLTELRHEIAARERAQQAEAEQRQWYETTLRSIGDGVIATDIQGRLVFLNGTAESLTGWTSQEAAGRPVEEIFVIHDERTGKPAEIPVHRVLREGCIASFSNHITLVSRGGRLIPIDDSAAPIRGPRGDLIGAVLVFRDVSVRRLAEYALEQSVSDMERFAYIASHDLQEPLRSVTNFAALLERRHSAALDQDAALCISFITEGARKMQRLIKDLLEYSRSGASAVVLQRVATEDLLRGVLSSLNSTIESTGAEITHDPLPLVSADPVKLSQVFQNLIANSLKFCHDHPCRVHISAYEREGHWTFTVRDNGIGFNPQYAGRIFEMFQRLHTGDQYEGSGIGLAISKRIIESHRGRIWAESSPGEGSTFYFSLPMEAPPSTGQYSNSCE
jgi:PAS domain S-box-containing protein